MNRLITFAVVALPLAGMPFTAFSQNTKAPIAQYWVDISTSSMMGMEEMPDMGALGGMMAGMMNKSSTGRDGKQATGIGNFGKTKADVMGRSMDTALYTSRKPNGSEAVHTVPSNAGLGAEPLQLVTPPREGLKAVRDEVEYPEMPKVRILFYWGCGAQVKAGQPRVFDTTKLSQQDYSNFMQGRSVRDRGAKAEPGHAIWPNEVQNSRIARNASLVGEHSVTGDGIPANMRFTLGAGQDFMPAMQVDSAGKLSDSIRVSWQSVPSARAYMLTALSGSEGKGGGADMVIWSSSEPPESGMGLMDYVSNSNIDKWLRDRVLLPASQTQCDIPAGIFEKGGAAMLRSIAYGSEANFSHPPRPANLAASAAFTPDWAVRVRSKSLAMNLLGDDNRMSQRNARPRNAPADQQQGQLQGQQGQQEPEQQTPGLLDALPIPGVGGLLKGLFGQ